MNGLDHDSRQSENDPESAARSIVLRRLSASPQTRSQLDGALATKGIPEDVRERVLDRFTDVNLIDDAAFSAAWVESRHTGRGLARRALGHELRQRGVDPTVADRAVEEVDAEQEEQMARALVVKRLRSTRRLDPATRTRRILSMLARKGYAPGVAYRIVREELEAEGVGESDLPGEPSPDD